MSTQEIWTRFGDEIYFFLLRKVKSESIARDILQNTFYKIHLHGKQLIQKEKIRSWVFSIARNETTDYFNRESKYAKTTPGKGPEKDKPVDLCCLDRFIHELPAIYREVIEKVYLQGKKQQEAAEELEISLANVKARIRRAKDILKNKFHTCCQFEIDENGHLTGEPDCPVCNGNNPF